MCSFPQADALVVSLSSCSSRDSGSVRRQKSAWRQQQTTLSEIATCCHATGQRSDSRRPVVIVAIADLLRLLPPVMAALVVLHVRSLHTNGLSKGTRCSLRNHRYSVLDNSKGTQFFPKKWPIPVARTVWWLGPIRCTALWTDVSASASPWGPAQTTDIAS